MITYINKKDKHAIEESEFINGQWRTRYFHLYCDQCGVMDSEDCEVRFKGCHEFGERDLCENCFRELLKSTPKNLDMKCNICRNRDYTYDITLANQLFRICDYCYEDLMNNELFFYKKKFYKRKNLTKRELDIILKETGHPLKRAWMREKIIVDNHYCTSDSIIATMQAIKKYLLVEFSMVVDKKLAEKLIVIEKTKGWDYMRVHIKDNHEKLKTFLIEKNPSYYEWHTLLRMVADPVKYYNETDPLRANRQILH